jgi:primosomal protein N' (replication factor Y)
MKYASVVLFKKLGEFDNELTYQILDSIEKDVYPGVFAEVPFHQRFSKGLVTDVFESLPDSLDPDKIRKAHSILPTPPLSKQSLKLAGFIARYYRTSMARALRLFLPKALWNGRLDPPVTLFISLADPEATVRGDRQKQVIETLKNEGRMKLDVLKKVIPGLASATLNSLLKKAIILQEKEALLTPFDPAKHLLKTPEKTLTDDQEKALEQIRAAKKPVLLYGVTGSGKTELYLRRMLEVMRAGKQVIYLVPEIALTPQSLRYFRDFFGDRMALFHSKLSDGQRAMEWWKVKSGYAPLVIGSRSAVFAPADRLGLVILDEEHEWTYKQESSPYYRTHRLAEELSQLTDAQVIFGSATPSAETYQKGRAGEYEMVHLPNRIHQAELPSIHVADLREEFKKRNFSVFSLKLQQAIRERLEKKEQIILFVNQRGMANAVVCRDCGYTEKCPNCEISLKLHRNFKSQVQVRVSSEERLVCHYCGFSKKPELVCPECRSPYIKHVGVGTQRVEEELKRLFPGARAVRADKDTTQSGDGFAGIYRSFLNHEYDVLIGTQMIAKGLDFSKVSLIGIVLADIGLHIPDFRSSERLFQILTQVSGRCGRREYPGEVILQTYNPDHPTIQKAAAYQYEDFIESELSAREKLNYPPFHRMVKFTVVGQDKKRLSDHIQQESEVLSDIFKVNGLDVKIISAPAMMAKMGGRYYYHVLLRADDPSVIFNHWKPPKGWRIDVDPIHTT